MLGQNDAGTAVDRSDFRVRADGRAALSLWKHFSSAHHCHDLGACCLVLLAAHRLCFAA